MTVAIGPQTGIGTWFAHMRTPAQRPPFPLPHPGAPDADPPTSTAGADAGRQPADSAKPPAGAPATLMPDPSMTSQPEAVQVAAAVAPPGRAETALPEVGQLATAQAAMPAGDADRPTPSALLPATGPVATADQGQSDSAQEPVPADRPDARAASNLVATADARPVAAGPLASVQNGAGRLQGPPAPATFAQAASPATDSAADDSKRQGGAGQPASGKAGQALATGSALSAPPIGPLPGLAQPARTELPTVTHVPLPMGAEHGLPPTAGPDAATLRAQPLSPQESAPEVVIGLVDGDRLDVRIFAPSEDSFDRLSGAEGELHAELAAIGTDVEAIRVELRNDLQPDEQGAADRAAADGTIADGARRDGTTSDREGRGQPGAGDGDLRQGRSGRAAEPLPTGSARPREAHGPGQEELRARSTRLVDRYA